MIPIPAPIDDPLNLADWLEFRALVAADGNASAADLRQAVKALGGGDGELLAAAAIVELKDRIIAAGSGYPFALQGTVLQQKSNLDPFWAYLFCLLLSIKGANRDEASEAPTQYFEETAEVAAGRYMGGRSMRFGFPRRTLPKKFSAALSHVCRELGEGLAPKRLAGAVNQKDGTLDIIAWRPFPDKRKSQIILFGQCAAGGNWSKKVHELNPTAFSKNYLRESPTVDPVKGFFIPFRMGYEKWQLHANNAGIIFDRCRIANLAHNQTSPPKIAAWIKKTLKELSK